MFASSRWWLALLCWLAFSTPASAQTVPAWTSFEQTWAKVSAYSATVAVFEREGTQVQNSVLEYTFSKPSSATVRFVAGANVGDMVVWSGGDTVAAHRGTGLAALFHETFALHDPRVTTIRGSSIDELSFAAFLAHAQGTPGMLSQEPGPTILDVPTVAVTLVPTSSATDDGVTREVVDIALATNLPLRVLGYDHDMLVRQMDFSNVKIVAR